jgi:predicted DNA-binding transcriptional regulator AlpA
MSTEVQNPQQAQYALSLRQVGQALTLSARSVWSLTKSGQLPSFQVGRRRLVSPAALNNFIADREAAEQQSNNQKGGSNE